MSVQNKPLANLQFNVINPASSLSPLQDMLNNHYDKIEAWFEKAWQHYPAPLTCSVDVRYAGYKLAPIDTNLFPAGFNNLHLESYAYVSQAFAAYMQANDPQVKKILIIPESHTRNIFYLTHLAYLRDIIINAGFECRIGTLSEAIQAPTTFEIQTSDLAPLMLEPVIRQDRDLTLQDFQPDFILLNNDLSSGIPEILLDVAQPMRPLSSLGWAKRLKTNHFAYYRQVSLQLSEAIGLDPWLLSPLFLNCGTVNFLKREGENCIHKNAEILLQQIQDKYQQYGIEDEPYVVVKADSGTYGMGVMTLKHPDEIYELNRKGRTKMAKSKSGQAISRVILQEGVYTKEAMQNNPSAVEPVVYLISSYVVGCFYRMHENKGSDQILNTPGMTFAPMSLHNTTNLEHFYSYSVVARLAALAAGHELMEVSHVD